ncbi:hypothetical protein C8R47DRAFT_1061965 [Mycena vitilis]|nr:hypothetical protein C8R47DRAFT_1061965 [Mycena vitilis]
MQRLRRPPPPLCTTQEDRRYIIDDDGFILCESRAICRYLADKYSDQGTPLSPSDLKVRALVEQAASFEFANFHPAATKVAMELLGKA